MKSVMLFAFSLLSIAAFSQKGKDSTAIVQLLVQDYHTMENWDIQKHLKNCTPDYTLIENGEMMTLADESNHYKKNAHRIMKRIDSFNMRTVQVYDNIGYAVYKLNSKIIENGTTKDFNWSESVILRKVKGAWKIQLIHSTPITVK